MTGYDVEHSSDIMDLTVWTSRSPWEKGRGNGSPLPSLGTNQVLPLPLDCEYSGTEWRVSSPPRLRYFELRAIVKQYEAEGFQRKSYLNL